MVDSGYQHDHIRAHCDEAFAVHYLAKDLHPVKVQVVYADGSGVTLLGTLTPIAARCLHNDLQPVFEPREYRLFDKPILQ